MIGFLTNNQSLELNHFKHPNAEPTFYLLIIAVSSTI
jgi:hypothetical protein